MYQLLEVLGLVLGALETEVKVKLRYMSIIYHQDKHKPEQTVITEEDSTTLFQILNNFCSYLRFWGIIYFCIFKIPYQYKSFNGINDYSYSYTVTY